MAYFYEFQQHTCILIIDHNVIVLAKLEYYRFQHVKGVHDDVYVESHDCIVANLLATQARNCRSAIVANLR